MNWEMIGAVAETVGAIGVIGSLIYLAVQVREGARATRRTNAHEVNESTRSWWAQLADDEQAALVWQRGLADPQSLTPAERLRFSCHMLQFVTLAEEAFFARDERDLPEWAGGPLRLGRREVASLPGFRTWYGERGHWLSPSFREVLETDMKEGSEHIAVHYSAFLPEGGGGS